VGCSLPSVTAYDDATLMITAHDPLRGPDRLIPYDQLMEDWKPFSYLYMIVYFPDDEPEVAALLGEAWDSDANRLKALALAEEATAADPEDALPGSTWAARWCILSATRKLPRPLTRHSRLASTAHDPIPVLALCGLLQFRPHRLSVAAYREHL